MLELQNELIIWPDLLYILSHVIQFCLLRLKINNDIIISISKYFYFEETRISTFCWYHQHYNHVDENNF